MSTRTTILNRDTPLARSLLTAQFTEIHQRVVDAPPARVWEALFALRWRDLRTTLPLMGLRTGFTGVTAVNRRLVDPPSPAAPLFTEPPRYLCSGMIGKPWVPWYVAGPKPADLDELAAFAEPGWLRYGMEWLLLEVPGRRTLVETATLCHATDDTAYRRFAAYWAVIRVFSGAVRLDILAALRRAATR